VLVVDESNPKNIPIVTIYVLKIVFCFLELIFIMYFLSFRWILLPYFKLSYMMWLNISIKECPTFYIMKNIVYNNEDDVCLFTIASSIIVFVLLISLQKIKLKRSSIFIWNTMDMWLFIRLVLFHFLLFFNHTIMLNIVLRDWIQLQIIK
jgi:hypothetical protein